MLKVARDVDVAERVFKLREERGWTQSELARRAGLSRTTLSHLEGGATRTPSSPTLRRLARAFGISVHDLLAETDAAEAEPLGAERQGAEGDRPMKT